MESTITRRWREPPTNLRTRTRDDQEAGEALRLSTESTQSVLADALGIHKSTVTRRIQGEAGPTRAFHRLLDDLAHGARTRGAKVEPGAVLTVALTRLVRSFTSFSGLDLRTLIRRSLDWETRKQAEEDIAEMDLVEALAVLPDSPNPAQAARMIEAVRSWKEAAIRETGWTITALAALTELERRLEGVAP